MKPLVRKLAKALSNDAEALVEPLVKKLAKALSNVGATYDLNGGSR
jgi:hypothetical protein